MKITNCINGIKILLQKVITNIIILIIIIIQKTYLISTDTIDYVKEKLSNEPVE